MGAHEQRSLGKLRVGGPGNGAGWDHRSRGQLLAEKGSPEEGWGVGNPTDPVPVLSYYNTTSVLLCLGITALVCLSVTIFSFQTKVSPGACGQGRARGSGIHVGLRRSRGLNGVWECLLEEGCTGLWG